MGALPAAPVTSESSLLQGEVQGTQLLPVHICCFVCAPVELSSLAKVQLDQAALLCQRAGQG